MKLKYFFILTLCLFSLSFISAIPGIPHQFYGNVIVNENPAPNNNIITASIEGQIYTTVTKDGTYGIAPNTFYIEDPNGDREGKTIFFYIGGKPAGTSVFQNNGYTKLDFSLTTTCGDNYCLGDETCGNCETDCGICTSPPVITITSPESKTYDTSKIDLKVSSDQPLIIWMYALDNENFITFNPGITLTLTNGDYKLTVLGINKVYQIGKSDKSFTVDVPYCGDLVCNNGETCSSCSQDCGACPSSSSSSSGGGGSSSSSSGGGGSIIKATNQTNTIVNLSLPKSNNLNDKKNENTNTQENKQTNSGILGAFSGFWKDLGIFKTIIVVIFVGGIAAAFVIVSMNRKRNREVSNF